MTETQKDPTEITGAQVLAVPMTPETNDAGADSIGGYLNKLLATLWNEEEGFDSKRPFGNSGWAYELYVPLIKAGHIQGKLDEDDVLDDLAQAEKAKGDRLIFAAIDALRPGKTDPPIAQAEVAGVEQEWKILLTTPDSSGAHRIHTVNATEPYLTGVGELEMHDTQGAVVAIYAKGEWTSVRRASTPEAQA